MKGLMNLLIAACAVTQSLFVFMKTRGAVDWPWWVVASPVLAPCAVVAVLVLAVVIYLGVNNRSIIDMGGRR